MLKKNKTTSVKSNLNIIIISSLVSILCLFCGFFISNINSKLDEFKVLKESNIQLEAELNNKKTELSNLKKELDEKNSTIEQLNNEISELNSTVDNLYY